MVGYVSCPVLAAPSAHQGRVLEGVLWMGLLILVIIGGVGATAWVRHRARESQRHRLRTFTLEELRQLRNRGTVTPEEYERLRDLVVNDLKQTEDGDR